MKLLRLLLFGTFINSIGTGLTAFGLGITAFDIYRDATAVAVVYLCAFTPIILLAPLAGVCADYCDRRLLMIIGDGGSTIGLLFIVTLLHAPEQNWPLILSAIVLSSVSASLTEPALRASISDLVTAEDHVRASGLLQLATAARYLASPVIAGIAFPWVGLQGLVLIDAATCLVTMLCSFAVMKRVGITRRHGAFQASEIFAGWNLLWGRRNLRFLIALMTAMTLCVGVVQVLFKPILLPYIDTATMGIVESVSALGLIGGALIVTLLGKMSPRRLLISGIAATGAAMILFAAREWPWWITLSAFAIFASLPLVTAGGETLVRRNIDSEHQGRVWGAISLTTQLGYIAAYIGVGPCADIAQHFLQGGHILKSTIGTIIGTGEGRGGALLIALSGMITIALAFCAHYSLPDKEKVC
ncbi:MAG: MFS transporter [Actinomycetaceae bacterium]|nr:MFS transporter [Actinomycetaceae bacterium]